MKNWYKSAPIKGILLILEHIFAVAVAVSLFAVMTYPGNAYKNAFKNLSKIEYEDTIGFTNDMSVAASEIAGQIQREENFETEGKYNPDKIVDIKEYAESGKITGKNVSGLAYRLDDLKEWSQSYDEYEDHPTIVVCQKADATYDYYKIEDFSAKVKSGEFRFWRDDNEEYLNALREGYVDEGYFGTEDTQIINADREIAYTDFWNFDYGYRLEEKMSTIDGKTLLQIANENPEWNGKLSQAYEYLYSILRELGQEIYDYYEMKDKWSEGNTNLTFLFADLNSGKLYSNRQKYTDMKQLSNYVEELKKNGKYVIATPKLADFETNMDTTAEEWCSSTRMGTDKYLNMVAVDTTYPIQDQFYTQNKLFDEYAPYMNGMLVSGIISIIGFFVGLIWLTIIAGRTTNDGEVKLVWFDKVKTELAAAAVIAVWVCCVVVIGDVGNRAYYRINIADHVLFGFMAFVSCAAFLFGYLSLVRRIKANTLWKNSVFKWFTQVAGKFLQYRSCTFKVTLAVLAFCAVHWFAIVWTYTRNGGGMLFVLAAEAPALYFVIRKAIAKQKIQKGLEEIVNGNVNYQIPLDGFKGNDLDMAGQINHIGEGFHKAVEQSMKDERLKTDLITNVSHDIKTPLTSIINYVDLLKRENIQDPKIQGYLDILEAKSQRLKQLTEDVVEASKISSGNITMEYMNIDFVEMINQTTGEFSEKFAKRNLRVVLNVPEHAVMIHSDGRRMWRVIENVYNNAAKYALEGTRVYADLIEKERTVEFSLKNISEQPLNITADELTERFIRGDVSRSTEGSGLGLSIAKNLTQMQGGEFHLYLDGDLFKVTIVFPKVCIEEK